MYFVVETSNHFFVCDSPDAGTCLGIIWDEEKPNVFERMYVYRNTEHAWAHTVVDEASNATLGWLCFCIFSLSRSLPNGTCLPRYNVNVIWQLAINVLWQTMAIKLKKKKVILFSRWRIISIHK